MLEEKKLLVLNVHMLSALYLLVLNANGTINYDRCDIIPVIGRKKSPGVPAQ